MFGRQPPASDGRQDDIHGLCPICRRTNGCLIVAEQRWFRCDEHCVVWNDGSDWAARFWGNIGERTDAANRARMKGYRLVKPFRWHKPQANP